MTGFTIWKDGIALLAYDPERVKDFGLTGKHRGPSQGRGGEPILNQSLEQFSICWDVEICACSELLIKPQI